jgi:hypothetical protein
MKAWNSVTRLWVDKNVGYSKEDKVHSCSRKVQEISCLVHDLSK